MTAPALPGAAPDPARLPPEVEAAIAAFGRTMDHGTFAQQFEARIALRATVITAMRAATAGSGAASPAAGASARALGGDGEPVAESVDAALAALDVEENLHPDRMEVTHTILGLDAVRAAHRAEVDAARLSKADEAFFDAAIALWQAQERVTELDRETGALDRDRDRLREAMRRFMQTGNESRTAESATIRARGVAKPRTGSEAPSASDEGAKS